MHIFTPFLVWEGPYIDMWSIAHTIAGLLLAYAIIYFFKLGRWQTFVSVIFIGALWEGIEQIIGTRVTETTANSIMDVVCAALGALAANEIMHSKLSSHDKWAIAIFAAFVFLILCLLRVLGA